MEEQTHISGLGINSGDTERIGMYELSYLGLTQWIVALYQSSQLKTMFPVVTSVDADTYLFQNVC